MSRFDDLWNGSKSELFRLQMLSEYIVEEEKGDLELAKQGKFEEIYVKAAGWFGMLKEKEGQMVKNINLQVVDLPLSDYLVFEAGFMLKSEEFGRETFFVKREGVLELISGFEDFWMFDNRTVLVMKYDKGVYLHKDVEVDNPEDVERYVELKEKLMKLALPLGEFLKVNNIEVKY